MSVRRALIVDSLVLVTVTICAYVGVFQNGFVELDDNVYVFNNVHTSRGLSWSGFRYAWTTFDSGNWIPLTWLSYQLDVSLFGMRPAGFHGTNLALHCANVLLCYAWLVRATGSRWRSLVVAAYFGLHPLHVESVAWISERKDVLSTFWLLMSLHAYTSYAVRPRIGWYVATCVAFALGLLSKSMIVTFPLLLCIVDIWPLQRWRKAETGEQTPVRFPQRTLFWLVIEKIPLFGMSLLTGLMTIAAASSSRAFATVTLVNRVGNALESGWWYVQKTLLPLSLSVLYPHPMNDVDWGQVAICTALLMIVSVYVVIFAGRRPHLLFGWAWFAIALLPVIGLLQVGSQAHADRYGYIPHVGLLTLVVWEGQYLLSLLPGRRQLTLIIVAFTTLAAGWLTVNQVAVWRSTETLWNQAIAVSPDNWFAHGALGQLCLQSDQIDDAIQHFQVVSDHRPEERASLAKLVDIYRRYPGNLKHSSRFYADLGRYHAGEHDMRFAANLFEKAVSLDSNNLSARNNLALALSQLGRDDEAETHLNAVLRRQPNDANAHVNLAVLLEKSNRLEDARQHLLAALQINSDDQDARNRLRDIEARLRR